MTNRYQTLSKGKELLGLYTLNASLGKIHEIGFSAIKGLSRCKGSRKPNEGVVKG
jgi:hypothetical protein